MNFTHLAPSPDWGQPDLVTTQPAEWGIDLGAMPWCVSVEKAWLRQVYGAALHLASHPIDAAEPWPIGQLWAQ